MSITERLEELMEAQARYTEAEEKERIARSDEIAARNRLNKAQKAFDEEVAKVRNESPGGDWKEAKSVRVREAP